MPTPPAVSATLAPVRESLSSQLNKLFTFAVISTLVRGVTVMVLWNWFVADDKAPFPQLPALSFLQALGLSIVVTVLTSASMPADDDRPFGFKLAYAAFWYALVWVFALAVRLLQS